jgi:hypothetical protein
MAVSIEGKLLETANILSFYGDESDQYITSCGMSATLFVRRLHLSGNDGLSGIHHPLLSALRK